VTVTPKIRNSRLPGIDATNWALISKQTSETRNDPRPDTITIGIAKPVTPLIAPAKKVKPRASASSAGPMKDNMRFA